MKYYMSAKIGVCIICMNMGSYVENIVWSRKYKLQVHINAKYYINVKYIMSNLNIMHDYEV